MTDSPLILDSHTHAWARWPYDPTVPDAGTRGSAEHLLWEMERHGVDQAVVVAAQIELNPANNEYVAAAAAASEGRLHHFADVDSLWSPSHHTAGAGDRLRQLSDTFGLKGFTHYVKDDNDGWFRSDDGVEFLTVAAGRGLILSLAAGPAWQEDVRWVAQRFPELTIMLHHLALVPAQGPEHDTALAATLPSADFENIVVKLSGLHYVVERGSEYPHPGGREVVRALYESFGPRRLLWGSDFPALTRYMTYTQSLDIVRTHCDFIDESELSLVLGENMRALLHPTAS
jgi:predicted TIM-barrel fold metal-dependent hydrolase